MSAIRPSHTCTGGRSEASSPWHAECTGKISDGDPLAAQDETPRSRRGDRGGVDRDRPALLRRRLQRPSPLLPRRPFQHWPWLYAGGGRLRQRSRARRIARRVRLRQHRILLPQAAGRRGVRPGASPSARLRAAGAAEHLRQRNCCSAATQDRSPTSCPHLPASLLPPPVRVRPPPCLPRSVHNSTNRREARRFCQEGENGSRHHMRKRKETER